MRRFHQIFLSICGAIILTGILMLVFSEEPAVVEVALWMAGFAGVIANLPLFYFASHVAFRDEKQGRRRRRSRGR